MKGIVRNIILLAIVLVLSYLSAECFGDWYGKFSPQTDDSWFSFTEQELEFIVGFPFAYIFFNVLLFKVFGEGSKKKWMGWTLLLAVLFFAAGDLKHIYLPIILAAVAWVVAKIVQVVWLRIKLR